MKLTCYSWPTCPHTETLDSSGVRVGVEEVFRPSNQPVEQKVADYPCPACTNPDANQNGIGTRPVPKAPVIPMSTSLMNPKVRDFRPATRQQGHNFISPSQPGFGHNLAMNDTATYGYTHGNHFDATSQSNPYASPMDPGNLYYNTPAGMTYLGQYPLSFNGQTSTGQIAHHSPISAALAHKTPTKKEIKAMAAARSSHKSGSSCPDGNPNCHWHYANWCHDDPTTCRSAQQAITAAFHAHDQWKDAPPGWNEAHAACIRAVNPVMCEFHLQLHRRILGSSY